MVKKKEPPETLILTGPLHKVFVVGGGYDYIKLMYDLGYIGAKGVGDADIILFTGGEDVDPDLYDEKPLRGTNFNTARDNYESRIYAAALELGIPMVGICRGGQFLNVMNHGKMWQHVDGHALSTGHNIHLLGKDNKPYKTIKATSTHHQMMIPAEDGVILATAAEATTLIGYEKEIAKAKDECTDVEVVWYPATGCFCFQPHPEYASATDELIAFFDECLDDFVVPYVKKKEE